jgi:tRNA pseudouridine38-40 synthase
MRTYKLTITYDGSKYQGWQRQMTSDLTIQGVLERTIGRIVGYNVEVHGSGRTDAGVHAMGQSSSLVLKGQVDIRKFMNDLNRSLPEDIKVAKIELMRNGFHARYNARGKRYEYYLDTREKPDVFTRRYSYHYPYELDVEAMRRAAECLLGTHEFDTFTDRKDKEELKSTRKTIKEIRIEREGDKMRFVFIGSGFLYHMVRRLTGTLLEVGRGERTVEDVAAALYAKDPSRAGFLVPARGLFLREVYYKYADKGVGRNLEEDESSSKNVFDWEDKA